MDLFLGVLFGAIGTGYVVYAKRQASAMFAICGVGLMIFPYLFSNAWAIVLVGAAITAAPFVIDRFG